MRKNFLRIPSEYHTAVREQKEASREIQFRFEAEELALSNLAIHVELDDSSIYEA